MANAVVSATNLPAPLGVERTNTKYHLYGNFTIGPAGASYVANGLPLPSFPNLVGPASSIPLFGEAYSVTTGYQYVIDTVHNTLRIYEGGAAVSEPLAELAVAALPAAVTSDTINFHLVFQGA